MPAAQVLPVPAGVDLVTAGGLPEVACTVWSNVVATGRLAGGRDVPHPGRQQRDRHPRDPGREGAGRPGRRDRGAVAGRPVPGAGRGRRHRLPRRRPRAAQEGDRRARRGRHPRQHGRQGPGRERRGARRRRPAAGHRHAGWDEGRARPQHAPSQAGQRHRDEPARPAGGGPARQGRGGRGGPRADVADDRRRAGAAGGARDVPDGPGRGRPPAAGSRRRGGQAAAGGACRAERADSRRQTCRLATANVPTRDGKRGDSRGWAGVR